MKNWEKTAVFFIVLMAGLTLLATCNPDPKSDKGGSVVNMADIGGVTAPVTRAMPKNSVTATTQYTGTVTWAPVLESGTFSAETVYTATITLTEKEDFTFTGVPENFFKVAGATSVTNAANSGVITAVFPKTVPVPNLPALRVEGDKILNGNGKEILLQGTNAGGYLVTEAWMNLISGDRRATPLPTWEIDHKPITEAFVKRFGKEKTLELWDHYRKNYWTEQDFINCADIGMNVLRLPFTYFTCDPEYNFVPAIPGEKYNFSILDDFILGAQANGIYTILDMHGAYGSQNGQNHSGETMDTAAEVDFYTNADKKAKTTELWTAIADRYKNNPNVAGYDLLNEPGEKAGATVKRHWDYFDELYKAIRAVDQNRIIIMESCWTGSDLPHPTNSPNGYNWNVNVMYSFHHYSHESGVQNMPPAQQLTGHNNSILGRVNEVDGRNFGIPVYMGEFTCIYGEGGWDYMLELLQERGWHWTTWTYKVVPFSFETDSPWGIFNTELNKTEYGIRADEDSFEEIKSKWSRAGTADESVQRYTFPSGRTLYDLFKDYCKKN